MLCISRDFRWFRDTDAVPGGQDLEVLDAFLAVIALRGDGRHVRPVEQFDYVDHSLGLEIVGRHRATEVPEPALIAQVYARRRVWYLRDLWDRHVMC